MDEMRIESALMRGLLKRILKKKIRKEFGYETDLDIQRLAIKHENGQVCINFVGGIKMDSEDLARLIFSAVGGDE